MPPFSVTKQFVNLFDGVVKSLPAPSGTVEYVELVSGDIVASAPISDGGVAKIDFPYAPAVRWFERTRFFSSPEGMIRSHTFYNDFIQYDPENALALSSGATGMLPLSLATSFARTIGIDLNPAKCTALLIQVSNFSGPSSGNTYSLNVPHDGLLYLEPTLHPGPQNASGGGAIFFNVDPGPVQVTLNGINATPKVVDIEVGSDWRVDVLDDYIF